MRLWWRNLNEDSQGRVKGWPYHGRATLHFEGEGYRAISWSWHLWSSFCGFSIDTSEGWEFHISFPPIALWLTFKGFLRIPCEDKALSVSVHDGAIWWNIWKERWNWSSRDGWRNGSLNFKNFLLGKPKYSEETFKTFDVRIPMPEGNYPATVRMFESTWRRSRWFSQRLLRADIRVEQGIPYEGKGENSWNCGKDATYRLTCPASTPEEAIGQLVESVLNRRRRYDGNIMVRYPKPKKVTPAPSALKRGFNQGLHFGSEKGVINLVHAGSVLDNQIPNQPKEQS